MRSSESGQDLELASGPHELHGELRKLSFEFCGIRPVWRKRFVLAIGGYIFKYAIASPVAFLDAQHLFETSRPKGTPIPLLHCEIDDCGPYCGERWVFCLATLSKTTYFAADSKEDLMRWVKRLKNIQNLALKQALGHVEISELDRAAKQKGDQLVILKKKVEEKEYRDALESSWSRTPQI